MKRRLAILGLSLGLTLGASLVLPHRAAAQDASADAGKRKVHSKVDPQYPELAKRMNLTGTVKIEATISADGHVTNTRVVGGSPVLVGAATDALKKWRFEPAAKDSVEVIQFDFTGQT
jgi:TonB family protein